jgi:hypothetical protein
MRGVSESVTVTYVEWELMSPDKMENYDHRSNPSRMPGY